MPAPHGFLRTVACLLVFVGLAMAMARMGAVRAQQQDALPSFPVVHPNLDAQMGRNPLLADNPVMAQRQMWTLQKSRYQGMKADTDRLQALAAKLAMERARDSGPYTPAQLRLLADIEKLAKRIKDTMRNDGVPSLANEEPFYGPPSMR